jgi:hypothetical protein
MIVLAPSFFQSWHNQNGDEEVYPKALRSKGVVFFACPLSKSGYFSGGDEQRVFIVIILGTVVPWSSRGFSGGEGSAC